MTWLCALLFFASWSSRILLSVWPKKKIPKKSSTNPSQKKVPKKRRRQTHAPFLFVILARRVAFAPHTRRHTSLPTRWESESETRTCSKAARRCAIRRRPDTARSPRAWMMRQRAEANPYPTGMFTSSSAHRPRVVVGGGLGQKIECEERRKRGFEREKEREREREREREERTKQKGKKSAQPPNPIAV